MADPSPFSTFGGLSTSEVLAMQSGIPRQGSRPVAPCNDDRLVPVLACPEHASPLAYPFPPNRGKGKGLPSRCQPSRLVQRDWPQGFVRAQPLQPHQSHQPRQQPSARHPTIPAQPGLWQGLDEPLPFKRECMRRIFKSLSEMPDSGLPVQLGPHEPGYESHPHFCAYHQLLGHALEDCFTFQEWLREAIAEGAVVLPAAFLTDPLASSESWADNSMDFSADSEDS